jgi:hypothetical protein
LGTSSIPKLDVQSTEIIAHRVGAEWMTARDWVEVDWALSRDRWEQSGRSRDPWFSR